MTFFLTKGNPVCHFFCINNSNLPSYCALSETKSASL